jgi:poly(3-hydroxybutyrate) depolymerase
MMPDEITALLKEPGFYGDPPQELGYEDMLRDLSRQALERWPRYDYRGRSARAVQQRQVEVRATVIRALGLTPRSLPAKPTSVTERPAVQYDGFSIRPVVIERGKGWYITMHLYVPDGLTRPAPAVMHVHGHSYSGKSTPSYARRCRGLARHGFVVLFVDYPEADERKGTGHALWYPVLAGMTVQGIMVADNSAALTYLAGLPFVDGERIGVTGASGGGNQTAFFAAVDTRVAAAAPCIAPTLFSYHASWGKGAWCHCEAVPGLAAEGVEYHDLLAAMAPKPVRVFDGILDPLFPIVGARLTVADAAEAYRALGAAGDCTLEEHFCAHDVPERAREGIYRFFSEALKRTGDLRGPRTEGEDMDLADPRLRALPRRPRDFRSIGDLYQEKLDRAKPKPLTAAQLNRLLARRPADVKYVEMTRYEDDRWVRALLQVADGSLVPVVLRKGKGKVTLALANDGKAEALGQVTGAAASFDWRGQGETAPPNDEWQQRALHYLAIGGESLCGGRVTDLLAAYRWLTDNGWQVGKVMALGGEASLVALYAACAEERLPKVELHGLARSFRDAPGLGGQLRYTAYTPGLALVTDIPELLSRLGRRAVVKGRLKPGERMAREGFS